MKEYKHVFWDLDHTLWDFETNSLVALRATYDAHNLADLGITDFEAFSQCYHMHNEKYWERFRKGFINRETLRWKRFYVTLVDFKIANEPLANALGHTYLEVLPLQKCLMPNAIEILNHCQNKNIQQHIITNGFEGTQNIKMQNSNILQYFTKIITSERAMSLKPQAAIYNYALQQTGAKASNSIMIGDALAVDVLGALDFGMDAVWLNATNATANNKIIPTHTITDLAALLEIL